MNKSSIIDKAKQFSTNAHHGQVRKGGEPYIIHPMRVAQSLPNHFKALGWMHDVLEDTKASHEDLREAGFSEQFISDLDVLTHREHEEYSFYINRIKERGLSLVKIADILDNLGDKPSDRARVKYVRALKQMIL